MRLKLTQLVIVFMTQSMWMWGWACGWKYFFIFEHHGKQTWENDNSWSHFGTNPDGKYIIRFRIPTSVLMLSKCHIIVFVKFDNIWHVYFKTEIHLSFFSNPCEQLDEERRRKQFVGSQENFLILLLSLQNKIPIVCFLGSPLTFSQWLLIIF